MGGCFFFMPVYSAVRNVGVRELELVSKVGFRFVLLRRHAHHNAAHVKASGGRKSRDLGFSIGNGGHHAIRIHGNDTGVAADPCNGHTAAAFHRNGGRQALLVPTVRSSRSLLFRVTLPISEVTVTLHRKAWPLETIAVMVVVPAA